ncbi:hypothetical protein B0H99_101147 [Planomicrobium soli]|uniref:Uncharacterized protein n=1 Tax=Planomicrobium soli TaxID=1176648 RepID=A0A2P8H6S4_9BACL|nr:hypothetical protein [Planomicrobium soli]PSL41901.1 hypothetical protein B0H99_101147 [Planomicrobium soli]
MAMVSGCIVTVELLERHFLHALESADWNRGGDPGRSIRYLKIDDLFIAKKGLPTKVSLRLLRRPFIEFI